MRVVQVKKVDYSDYWLVNIEVVLGTLALKKYIVTFGQELQIF